MMIEQHRINRIGWLRASVLGANDGILSTSSLVVGVAAANTGRHEIILAGIAGLVAGALSMAAGEYVSVSSQTDTEQADLARERAELAGDPEGELEELAAIYVVRGLDQNLAKQVAIQLTQHDALGAHARDELGITEVTTTSPLQAAMASAVTFATGAALPLLVVSLAPLPNLIPAVSIAALAFLFALGWISARAGGATPWRGGLRIAFWGVLAMTATSLIGFYFGTSV